MFIDQVDIYLKAGNGGNGIVAYRREKYVPLGGPAGGDGGNGADIIFEVDEGLRTLMDFRYQRHFKAKHGQNGMSSNAHGRNSEPLILKVPPGTIVKRKDTGETLADLVHHGAQMVIAKGGRGGRGNSRFASSRNPAPDFAENGEPGEEFEVTMELKLLADVGLVGFPSVGKSTILSAVSKAKAKRGDYPFTTIKPNLGVVQTGDGRSFVMADLPGLIEGASEGTGLGHQFLRHVERTRVIVHVIDISGLEGRDPIDDYRIIREEMGLYNESLLKRPEIIVLNKVDLVEDDEIFEQFRSAIGEDKEIHEISAATRQNLDTVLYRVADLLEETPETEEVVEETDHRVLYRYEKDPDAFKISRDDDGAFVVTGDAIERMFKMTDFNREAAIRRFARQMRSMGIDDALRERGIQTGDTVRILGGEFEFVE
ncbi:GTPase ObgE [Salinicoccus sp. ID82-1]|uniref:GTPase ObgE n=1 Tax=Salinicoccus sp. ID82-1 TaxID=2820269 RepID=UPI001F017824|nr:GTPase ObgE [Salinicoccus sp. ID82-1]MCG1008856.1 GTPase ObgE [Salinicoccus sp. ID82-1]